MGFFLTVFAFGVNYWLFFNYDGMLNTLTLYLLNMFYFYHLFKAIHYTESAEDYLEHLKNKLAKDGKGQVYAMKVFLVPGIALLLLFNDFKYLTNNFASNMKSSWEVKYDEERKEDKRAKKNLKDTIDHLRDENFRKGADGLYYLKD